MAAAAAAPAAVHLVGVEVRVRAGFRAGVGVRVGARDGVGVGVGLRASQSSGLKHKRTSMRAHDI